MTEPLLTVADVAELTKFDCETIRRAIRAGRLRASKPAGAFRIRPEAVDAWLESTEVEPAAAIAEPIVRRIDAPISLPSTTPASSVRERMKKQRTQRTRRA